MSGARIHRERHQAHIAAGNCPSVDWAKTWCNLKAHHAGNHRAPGIAPTRGVDWTEREAKPCPCEDLNGVHR